MVKNLPGNASNTGSILGLGRSPGVGNGNPLQYSCLGSPMDRRAWWAIVHGVAKSWTGLKQLSTRHSLYKGNETVGLVPGNEIDKYLEDV